MRRTSWRRGDKTPAVVVKSWQESTPSGGDRGFVAESRWYAAWEILSRDKACPVECRGSNASRSRASRKIGRGRQNGHLGEPVCALDHFAPDPPVIAVSLGEGGRGVPFARPPSTSWASYQPARGPAGCDELYGQRCWCPSAHK